MFKSDQFKTSINANDQAHEIWNKNSLILKNFVNKEQQMLNERQKLTDIYMKKFEEKINLTIKKNNSELYKNMSDFLIDLNKKPSTFDSQVPTSLVITSSESASSIETQFQTLLDELHTRVKTNNLVLDEKKCGNIKSTIEHIIH
jgi:hypothetical protein